MLLKSPKANIKFASGNYTWTGFENTKMFPEVKFGSVTVKHVTDTGEVLEDTTTVVNNEPIGTAYTTSEKTFSGYRFKELQQGSAPANGTVTEETKHVEYVYEKIPNENIKSAVDTSNDTTTPLVVMLMSCLGLIILKNRKNIK